MSHCFTKLPSKHNRFHNCLPKQFTIFPHSILPTSKDFLFSIHVSGEISESFVCERFVGISQVAPKKNVSFHVPLRLLKKEHIKFLN